MAPKSLEGRRHILCHPYQCGRVVPEGMETLGGSLEIIVRSEREDAPLELDELQLDGVFGALREKEQIKIEAQLEAAAAATAGAVAETKQRHLLLVTRKWRSRITLELG